MGTTRPRGPKWPKWNETIALFGGRFDPPHLGHLEAIQGLFQNPGVSQVWILPSPTPAHKSAVASREHRLEMTRLGLLDKPRPGIRLDLREFERSRLNPQLLTYTFDTLQEVRRETQQIAFVIGTDQLEQFSSWHRFPEVLKLSHWIVLGRKPDGIQRGEAVLREWEASGLIQKSGPTHLWSVTGSEQFLTLVPTEARNISSTAIREALARTGEPPEDSLQPAVLAYLKQNALYGTRSHL